MGSGTTSQRMGQFLRSYGPTPNNLTMFDEYVANALGRAKVALYQPVDTVAGRDGSSL